MSRVVVEVAVVVATLKKTTMNQIPMTMTIPMKTKKIDVTEIVIGITSNEPVKKCRKKRNLDRDGKIDRIRKVYWIYSLIRCAVH